MGHYRTHLSGMNQLPRVHVLQRQVAFAAVLTTKPLINAQRCGISGKRLPRRGTNHLVDALVRLLEGDRLESQRHLLQLLRGPALHREPGRRR